jgi:HEAT repeat protein
MIEALTWTAVGLAVAGILSVSVLALRRLRLVHQTRRRLAAEARLRPLALGLVDGQDVGLELDESDARILAALLARYARRLDGEARGRISAFFEERGDVAREINALSSFRSWRRARAASILGDMGSQRAVASLRAALGDPSRDVRAAAARSLGRLGAKETVPALVYSLVRQEIPRTTTAQALLAIGPAALPRLRPLLVHPEAEVKVVAVELVGLLGDSSDADALVDRLRDTSAEVRAKACRALGRVGAAEAVDELRETLADRIPFVRATAAIALGELGDREAVPALLAQAREEHFDAAQAAARAVARIDPAALAAAAREPGPTVHLREAAGRAAVLAR